jgi:CRISPR-associated protein (TIGR02710 family)
LVDIVRGLAKWDNFAHKTAHNTMNKGIKALRRILPFVEDTAVENFFEMAETCFGNLDALKAKTKNHKRMHAVLVADLVANSRRRAIQEKYDDAVARLYRAMEMAGQVAFESRFDQPNTDVPADIIPDVLRSEFVHRYAKGPKKLLQLPATATFRVLKEVGDPLGVGFFDNQRDIDALLSSRNLSILAHGQAPVKKETYERFVKLVTELFVEEPMAEFPILNW